MSLPRFQRSYAGVVLTLVRVMLVVGMSTCPYFSLGSDNGPHAIQWDAKLSKESIEKEVKYDAGGSDLPGEYVLSNVRIDLELFREQRLRDPGTIRFSLIQGARPSLRGPPTG